MTKKRHNILDCFFHAVEFTEGRINFNHFVGKEAAKPWVIACIDHFRFTNGL